MLHGRPTPYRPSFTHSFNQEIFYRSAFSSAIDLAVEFLQQHHLFNRSDPRLRQRKKKNFPPLHEQSANHDPFSQEPTKHRGPRYEFFQSSGVLISSFPNSSDSTTLLTHNLSHSVIVGPEDRDLTQRYIRIHLPTFSRARYEGYLVDDNL